MAFTSARLLLLAFIHSGSNKKIINVRLILIYNLQEDLILYTVVVKYIEELQMFWSIL